MELSRLAELARQEAGREFHLIAHFQTKEALWEAFDKLRKNAAAGVDGITCADCEEHLIENLGMLHERLTSKTHRAQPLRRIYVDKEDGQKRPISIPALEDSLQCHSGARSMALVAMVSRNMAPISSMNVKSILKHKVIIACSIKS